MKATQKDFAGIAPRAARAASVFLLCGPDEAGVQDAATRIAELLPDAGERVEFTGAELRKDPVRLGDEARSTSLFGDARHIWVRTTGDEIAEAVSILLGGEATACPVLIVAPGATDKSKVAKLLEGRSDALVAHFWPPDARDVVKTVRDMAAATGMRLDDAGATRIARAANHDTRLARSEIEKLALYLDASPQTPRTADAAAFEAIGARTEDDSFAPLVACVLGGETGRLAAELRRARETGMNPVGLLLAFERRAAQLALLSARLGPGGDVADFLAGEKQARRVMWKDVGELTRQLTRWRGPRLERLIGRLAAAHRRLLANAPVAELLLADELTAIARVAAR